MDDQNFDNPLDLLYSDEFERVLSENLKAIGDSSPEIEPSDNYKICLIGEAHGAHHFLMKSPELPGSGAILIRQPTKNDNTDDILIDPGWGTLAVSRRLGVSLANIGTILISHCHLDHIGDLHSILMYLKFNGKSPTLISNNTSINGAQGQPSILPEYFRNICSRVIAIEAGSTRDPGNFSLFAFNSDHVENPHVSDTLSFILTFKETSIAYLSDGPFNHISDDVLAKLRSCHSIMINIGTMSALPQSGDHSKVFDNATCFNGVYDILKRIGKKKHRVKQILISHLGAELLEIKSPSMKRFLDKNNLESPISLLNRSIKLIVNEFLGPDTTGIVLREGDTIWI